jgi:SHS family lactate transporter-like MFS transporter
MPISAVRDTIKEQANPGWQFAVVSCILGWVLDAFDFFVLIFLFDILANHFQVKKLAIVYTLSLTLAMRPVGALLFGSLADRFGRKIPMIVCVLYFSTITVLSGFAPNYMVFLVLRGLYGIGMGGYWGIGASYAMESAPSRLRGFLSGLMQSGYSLGYLLVAVAMQTLVPAFGWRSLFVVGAVVAVLIVLLAAIAPESKAWTSDKATSLKGMADGLFKHRGLFLYLTFLMAVMLALAHGTGDLYPDFLKSLPFMNGKRILGMQMLFGIPVLYNIGAIGGALWFGYLSEKIGRRRSIMLALLLSLLSIPAWAYGHSVLGIVLGSFFMQVGVQGAFGVIPAHLNELSPDTQRGLFPGLVYQLGILLTAPAVAVEYILRDHLGYPKALTLFELSVILILLLLFAFGPERLGRRFGEKDAAGYPSTSISDPR